VDKNDIDFIEQIYEQANVPLSALEVYALQKMIDDIRGRILNAVPKGLSFDKPEITLTDLERNSFASTLSRVRFSPDVYYRVANAIGWTTPPTIDTDTAQTSLPLHPIEIPEGAKGEAITERLKNLKVDRGELLQSGYKV
jgi:hypothetical protein